MGGISREIGRKFDLHGYDYLNVQLLRRRIRLGRISICRQNTAQGTPKTCDQSPKAAKGRPRLFDDNIRSGRTDDDWPGRTDDEWPGRLDYDFGSAPCSW
jgi:hypothetical protein